MCEKWDVINDYVAVYSSPTSIQNESHHRKFSQNRKVRELFITYEPIVVSESVLFLWCHNE